jgi:hypothetical protein
MGTLDFFQKKTIENGADIDFLNSQMATANVDISALETITATAEGDIDTLQADLTSHTGNTTTAHGAVSTATASKIMIRDSSGRAKVAAPSAEDDIALKSNVTTVQDDLDTHKADIANQNSNRKLKFIACAIRNTGSGFALINDAEHEPIGVTSVSNDTTKIVLNYDFTAIQVLSLVVVPDEIMAKNGIIVGGSVGLALTNIYAYKQYSASAKITKSGGDTPSFAVDGTLFNGVTSVASADAGLTMEVTHDICDIPNYKIGSCVSPGLLANPYPTAWTTTTTSFKFLAYPKMFGANVSYNGSSFVRSTNHGVNSAVWNASGNSLDITLSQAFSNLLPSVSPRSACIYIPRIYSYDTATGVIQIRFYDVANTLITAADTYMNVFVQGTESYGKDIIPADGDYYFEKTGYGKMNPNDLTYAGANFWIYGVMEVE